MLNELDNVVHLFMLYTCSLRLLLGVTIVNGRIGKGCEARDEREGL